MDDWKQTLKDNKFKLHLTALLMMLIPPIPMYLIPPIPMYWAAQNSANGLIWLLMGIVILGNLIVIIVP
jgi:hypothetical protein